MLYRGEIPWFYRRGKKICRRQKTVLKGFLPFEGLILNDISAIERTGAYGRKIAGILEDGPHCAAYIAERLSRYERMAGVKELMDHQLINTISMTPTDLLHINGMFTRWDADASVGYARQVAAFMKTDPEEMTDMLVKRYRNQLTKAVIDSILYFEGVDMKQVNECSWLERVLFDDSCRLNFKGIIGKPIVALGASAGIWISGLSDMLEVQIRCPEHADVANAVGAARGILGETIDVVISYDMRHDAYSVHLPWETFVCGSYEEARHEAMIRIDDKKTELENRDGVAEYSKSVTEDSYGMGETDSEDDQEMVFKSVITVRLTGVPKSFAGFAV